MLYQILNRISYAPSSQSLARLEKIGLENFLDEQLSPKKEDSTILQEKIEKFKFSSEEKLKGKRFHYLHAPLEELWKIAKDEKVLEKKSAIPAAEVMADTCLRAVYSDWQLQEIMVQFWHNHFNVSIEAADYIPVLFPLYDQNVIRKNCFGNFRVFLEDVAQSPAMLWYLNNSSNRASPANENYARELFELHTLGEDNYLNHLYNKWREVPGATEGKATGYIDENVYEAARAFTGWTVADGEWGGEEEKPSTGKFLYLEKWHDNYQKRIMGIEFESNQAPLADGKKVLDILAAHEGTARFVCTKICRRFIADQPPQSIIDKAVKVWLATQSAPDQIKQVLKTILLSEELKESLGKKIKNPLDLTFSIFRKLGVDFTPNLDLMWLLEQMGYRLFSWPTPTGHPDKADYWLNSNMMLQRWNLPAHILDNWANFLSFKIDDLVPKEEKTSRELVLYWLELFLGKNHQFSTEQQNELVKVLLREDRTADQPPLVYDQEDKYYLFIHVIALIFMSPTFQYR